MLKVTILLLIASLSYAAENSTKGIPVETDQLKFQYMSSDGEIQLDCHHSRIRDLPDWEVVCGKGTPTVKKFAVHFVANKGSRLQEPKVWYEFLYWVTDRQQSEKPAFSSTSMTLNLNSGSVPHSLRLYQGIENDYASLIVDYTL